MPVFLFWRKVNGLLILAQDYLDCSSSYFGGNADGSRKPGGNPGGGNKPAKKNEKNIENPSNSCDLKIGGIPINAPIFDSEHGDTDVNRIQGKHLIKKF